MEKNLQEQIKVLEGNVREQEDEILKLNDRIKQTVDKRSQIIETNDNEIAQYEKRIDEMSSDFAIMLKDTLTKMQERIAFANKDWEDENNANIIKKFDEMTDKTS